MFVLLTDENVLKEIDFFSTEIIPKDLDLYIKKFYTLPNIINLSIKMGEFTIFPDIFLRPYPMVSEMVMNVMMLYRIQTFSRKVILSDKNSEQYKIYYLLYIDENSEFLYKDFILYRTSKNNISCTISLDFAESILNRGAKGIILKEINESGE